MTNHVKPGMQIARVQKPAGVARNQIRIPSQLYEYKIRQKYDNLSVLVTLRAKCFQLIARELGFNLETRSEILDCRKMIVKARCVCRFINGQGVETEQSIEIIKNPELEMQEAIARWETGRWNGDRFEATDCAANYFKLDDPKTGEGHYELPISAIEEINRNFTTKRRHAVMSAITIAQRNIISSIVSLPTTFTLKTKPENINDFLMVDVFSPKNMLGLLEMSEDEQAMDAAVQAMDEQDAARIESEDDERKEKPPENPHEKPSTVPVCPKCGGPMNDLRNGKDHADRGPDFRCQDRNCKWKTNKAGEWVQNEYVTCIFPPKSFDERI